MLIISSITVSVSLQFLLLSKSAFLEWSIEENSDQEECIIKLNDIPGGAKSFELVARFCYGCENRASKATRVNRCFCD
jgi:hypothetical protein